MLADTVGNVFTALLTRAVEVHDDGAAGVASLLRVPETTFQLWMKGSVQVPSRAFFVLLEALRRQDIPLRQPARDAATKPLTFMAGPLRARCARCEATEFLPAEAHAPLKLTSELACAGCGERVVQGDLIARLARECVRHAGALTAARTKRAASRRREKPV